MKECPCSRSCALSSSGNYAALGRGEDVVLWDRDAGMESELMVSGARHDADVAFSPDERILAASGSDQVTTLWDVESRKVIATLPSGSVHKFLFSLDSQTLATCGSSMDSTFSWLCLPAPSCCRVHRPPRVRSIPWAHSSPRIGIGFWEVCREPANQGRRSHELSELINFLTVNTRRI